VSEIDDFEMDFRVIYQHMNPLGMALKIVIFQDKFSSFTHNSRRKPGRIGCHLTAFPFNMGIITKSLLNRSKLEYSVQTTQENYLNDLKKF